MTSSPQPGCRSLGCASTGLGMAAVSAKALTLSYRCRPAPTPTMPSPAPRIRALPEGIYRYGFDTDGLAEPFRFELTLTIRDGGITADYAGSSPQQPRAIHRPLTYTNAMTPY